jgi:hypothetical protein
MSLPPGFDPYGDLFKLLVKQPELTKDPDQLAELRRKLVWAFSWAVPSREAVEEIVRHGPLIEIGAGTGYWAWLLGQAGAEVVAFDCTVGAPPHWSEVKRGGPEQISQFPGHTLFLCWPPLGEPLAEECLELYEGPILLSIGEKGDGARTGDARFRNHLKDRFIEEREIALSRWPGYSDSLTIYRRRS